MGDANDRALATWDERDRARAIHPSDHAAVTQTSAARALVLELFESPVRARDLFNASARLGRLMAEGGASPSLVAGTIGAAVDALAAAGTAIDPARASAAQASLLEGYLAAIRETEQAAARRAWAYPACVVPLGDDAIAIACGLPEGDAEALAEWAGNVAARASKAKVRRALLSGNPAACAAVASALESVGIALTAPEAPAPAKGWLRLPWRK